jgi:hypothetical protein
MVKPRPRQHHLYPQTNRAALPAGGRSRVFCTPVKCSGYALAELMKLSGATVIPRSIQIVSTTDTILCLNRYQPLHKRSAD